MHTNRSGVQATAVLVLAAGLHLGCGGAEAKHGDSGPGDRRDGGADAALTCDAGACSDCERDGEACTADAGCEGGQCGSSDPRRLDEAPGCVDGFCWESPLPVGGTLTSVFARTPTDVWLTTALHFVHYDGDTFSQVPMLKQNGRPAMVTGLWGAAADDVWAATGGGLLHWDGSEWSAHAERVVASKISGVAADDVWAAGTGGLFHFDGESWSPVALPAATQAVDVWAHGPNEVAVAAAAGKLLNVVGEEVTDLDYPASAYNVFAAYAVSSEEVWGGSLSLRHRVDGTWTPVSLPGASGALIDIWGSAADDVWFVNEGNGIYHWNGSEIEWHDRETSFIQSQVSGTSTSDVWFTSAMTGVVHHYDGARWEALKGPLVPVFSQITRIAAGPDATGWAIAHDGLTYSLLRQDATADWSVSPAPAHELHNVGYLRSEAYLFGEETLYRWSGDDWAVVSAPNHRIRAACRAAAGTIHAVGSGYFRLEADTSVADTEANDGIAIFEHVICAEEEAWAHGERTSLRGVTRQELAHFDGHGWHLHQLRSTSGVAVLDGYLAPTGEAWALLGLNYVMRRPPGGEWREVRVDGGPLGLDGKGDDNLWFVGHAGSATHFDGTDFVSMPIPSSDDFEWVSVAGSAATAVSGSGAVWTFDSATSSWTDNGASFAEEVSSTRLVDVAFAGDRSVAVGDAYEALELVEGEWIELPGDVSASATAAGEAVGAFFLDTGGNAHRWNGSTMTDVARGSGSPDRLMVTQDGLDVYTYDSDSGVLEHFDGSQFVREGGVSQSAVVFGTSASDLWAIGETDDGLRLAHRRTDKGWSVFEEPPHPKLMGTTAGGEVLGVDASGTVRRRTEDGWEVVIAPSEDVTVTGGLVVDDDDIWLMHHEQLMHWNGETWDHFEAGISTLALTSMSRSKDGRLLVGGRQGAILGRPAPK